MERVIVEKERGDKKIMIKKLKKTVGIICHRQKIDLD